MVAYILVGKCALDEKEQQQDVQESLHARILIEDLRVLALRVRLKTSSRIAELSQHEADGGELQEGEAAAVEIFPVLGETAAAIEPSNRALDQRPYNVAKSHSRRSVMGRMGRPEAEPER